MGLNKTKRLVCGVGINDANHKVNESITISYINGKQKQKKLRGCPYYRKWVDLLKRCYSDKYRTKYPTYKGCTLEPEWLYFSGVIYRFFHRLLF